MSLNMSKVQKLPRFCVCEKLKNICIFGGKRAPFVSFVIAYLFLLKSRQDWKLRV